MEKSHDDLRTKRDVVLLSLAAGCVDAIGYLDLGNVFTANMTGNIVLLGIALSQGHLWAAGRTAFVLLAFSVGTCLGAWLYEKIAQRKRWNSPIPFIFACEAVLLLIFAGYRMTHPHPELGGTLYPWIAVLGLSMGLQGAAVFRVGIPGVTTTVVTGTLTALLSGLMKSLHAISSGPSDSKAHPVSLGLQMLIVVTYCVGAGLSGFLMLHHQNWVGLFPAALVSFVAVTRMRKSD